MCGLHVLDGNVIVYDDNIGTQHLSYCRLVGQDDNGICVMSSRSLRGRCTKQLGYGRSYEACRHGQAERHKDTHGNSVRATMPSLQHTQSIFLFPENENDPPRITTFIYLFHQGPHLN